MLSCESPLWVRKLGVIYLGNLGLLLILSIFAAAQTTVSTGAVIGVIRDQSSAAVAAAKVTIANAATNREIECAATELGLYNCSFLAPGSYKLNVEAKGFASVQSSVVVQLGTIRRIDVTLKPQGSATATSALGLHTEQATVQGVVNEQQFQILPLNGSNFLDMAQLQPGLQSVDAAALDPTKNGFFAVSINGRSGRSTRIELDGVEINDETVGTTTENIPVNAIQELQIARSSLDLSSSLTSSGTVNITTESGTNTLHGEGMYFFRDRRAGFANFPGGQADPYQRNQALGNVGGSIIKDKLFFFVGAEHTKQDFVNPVILPGNFASLSGRYSAPFRDSEYLGRMDYALPHNAHLFYRFTYNDNSVLRPSSDFSPFLNRDNTTGHALGVDFNTGLYAHSLRFGYGKFWNGISPASGPGIYDPFPGVNLSLGSFVTGPNPLAPQVTIQSNKQARYDGSRPWRNHIFRYGFALDRIAVGGFAAFGANAPTVTGDPSNTSNLGSLPGGAGNPLNYAVSGLTIYNGQGFFSERPAFGYPGGGYFDTRIALYAGDTWKVRRNVTITYGLRYVRDTGRTDSDLAPIPCSATSLIRCSGNLLDQFGYGSLGNRIRQPNKNFGPQVGVAWDPSGTGTTVFRAGVGVYYENNLFNNIFFDRTVRLQRARVFGSSPLCPSGDLPWPDGTVHASADGLDIATQICGQPVGATVNGVVVGNAIADLQRSYQAAVASAAPYNPSFLGNTLSNFGSLLAPSYVTPRSVEMNAGLQKQIGRSTVLSVDYVRNVGTHFLLGVDTNRVGDAGFLDVGAAQRAVAATAAGYGCGGGYNEAAIQCALANGATIINFAQNGLDSANTFCGGFPCAVFGKPTAAFSGINPSVGTNRMYFPVGRSLYTGLQTTLRTEIENPARGVRHLNLQVAYAWSRFEDNVPVGGSGILGDQDFLATAADFRNPNRFFGPSALDRTHQISFGPILDLVKGFQLSVLGHVDSPLPLTMLLPQEFHGGDIFISDFTGDGTAGDIVPGSNIGTFGRTVKSDGLTRFISSYMSSSAGQLTPAGQALVNAGVMTQQDLVTLGATTPVACPVGQSAFLANGIPCISPPPLGNANLGWLKTIDAHLSWTYRIKDRVSLQPSVSVYNVLNFANFDAPGNVPSGVLSGVPGYSINNITDFSRCTNCNAKQSTRIGPGSGVYSLGAPRQTEFSLKISF